MTWFVIQHWEQDIDCGIGGIPDNKLLTTYIVKGTQADADALGQELTTVKFTFVRIHEAVKVD